MKWGRNVRSEWRLDPDFLTVNHGSFGATPLCVRAAQDAWRERMEAQPTRFMSQLPPLLRAAANVLGGFLGAEGNDIVFTDNATTGCNAVLRSLALKPYDEILVLSHVYGAVRNTVRFVTKRADARMTEAAIPFPDVTDDGVVEAVANALTPRTRLAVVDHIASHSALVLPAALIVAACHAAGVPVLIDGAHAPGQIDVDLTAIGADFYTGNCHKWLCAPKGSAFLWVAPAHQASLHPPVISHGLGSGFLAEFDWTGTRDPSAALSVPAAVDFHQRLGGAALRVRNIALAAAGAALVAKRLNTETVATGGAMGLVRLPWEGPPMALRARLLAAGTDAPVHAVGGANWLRLSAFAYNELEDFTGLADLVTRVLSNPDSSGVTSF
jgi:isopenicillin-N epimerase